MGSFPGRGVLGGVPRWAWSGAVVAAAVLLAAPTAQADRVHLRDGRVIEGQVKSADSEKVVIAKKYGDITFRRDDVIKIDYELTAEQVFEKALAEADGAEACLAAARQAEKDGIPKDKITPAYEKAVRLDPSCREAHEALGHLEVNGRWLSDDDAKREAGWIDYDGELMPPEKVAELRQRERDKQRAAAEGNRDAYLKELQGVPWGAAKPIETAHYIIKCNSSPAVAQRYADFMEKIYAAYDEVFAGYKRYFTGKSTIYIFRSVKDFQEYGGGSPGVGGFYRPKSANLNHYPDRIVSAYHGTFGTTGDTREVLAHEGTHQFQHILCDGSPEEFLGRPAWWVEGLAVYFGDGYKFDKKGNLEIGIPRDRLMVLQRYLQSGKVMPISQFIRLPYRNFSMMAGISYPYGWALCHYFLHRGEQVQGRGPKAKKIQKAVTINGKQVELAKVFKEFFDFVLSDPPDGGMMRGLEEHYAKKLESLLGFPVDDITEDWKAYVLGLELERLGEISKDKKKFLSTELAFEVSKPDGFEWREEDTQGREAIRFEDPATTALVIVTAEGNMDNSALEELADNAERGAAQKLESIYVDNRTEIEVGGYRAIEMFYEGKEAGAAENATREVKARQTEQRYRHMVIDTVKRSYEIVMQADMDRFDDNKAAFDAIVRSFKVLE